MRLKQASPVIRIPGADAVIQAALGQGIHFLQPIHVSGNLPVAKHFHDSAQLAVRSSVEIVLDRAFGKSRAEGDVTVFIHGTAQFKFAQRPLRSRVEMRESLGIIPDMRAGTMATTGIGKTAFPTPQVAIFQTQHGGRLEDGQICGDRIQHIGRQGRGKQCLLKRDRARSQGSVVLFDVKSYFAGIIPNGGVVGTPGRRSRPRTRTAAGRALSFGDVSGNSPANLQVAIGKVPCDQDSVSSGRARRQCSLEKNGSTIPPAGVDLVGPFIGRECAGGDFAPECRQRVKFPSRAAQPHPFNTGLTTYGNQASAAVTFGRWLFHIVQKHTPARDHSVAALRFVLAASGRQVRKMIGELILNIPR